MLYRTRGILLAFTAAMMIAAGVKAAQPPHFERTFLGIRLMSRGIAVLRKYGSPSKVITSSGVVVTAYQQRLPYKDVLTLSLNDLGSANTGAPGAPPAGPVSGYGPGSGPYGPGSGPYGPGSGAPGIAPNAQPLGGSDTGGGPGAAPTGTQWVYDYPAKGFTNVFTLNEEGNVIAIWQLGAVTSAKTARGVGLGSTYSDVVRVYGFPESHLKSTLQSVNSGASLDTLDVSYMETHGAEFLFINQRLRGHPNFKGQGPWCVGVIVGTDDFVFKTSGP